MMLYQFFFSRRYRYNNQRMPRKVDQTQLNGLVHFVYLLFVANELETVIPEEILSRINELDICKLFIDNVSICYSVEEANLYALRQSKNLIVTNYELWIIFETNYAKYPIKKL